MIAVRLNGWQRLWVVVSVLYLLAVVILVAVSWPTVATTWHKEEFITQMPEDARKFVVASYANQWSAQDGRGGFIEIMPNGAVLLLGAPADPRLVALRKKYPQYDDLSDTELVSALRAKFPEYANLSDSVIRDEDFQKVVKAYSAILNEAARTARWSSVRFGLLMWLIPCIGLYALGWAVAWVRRGFSRPSAGQST